MSLAYGEETLTKAQALDLLRERLAVLRDPTAPEALAELAAHLPVVNSMWQRFAADAMRAKRADDKAKLMRAALQAQQAYARTFTLLRALGGQAGGVVVNLDDGADTGADAGSA